MKENTRPNQITHMSSQTDQQQPDVAIIIKVMRGNLRKKKGKWRMFHDVVKSNLHSHLCWIVLSKTKACFFIKTKTLLSTESLSFNTVFVHSLNPLVN